MSPFAQSTFVAPVSRPLRARAASHWFSSHITFINVATCALLVAVSIAYIIQVNNSASKGYQIRALENSIRELRVANEQDQLEIREAQSLQKIQRAVKMIGMVPSEQATYVDVQAGSVAIAR